MQFTSVSDFLSYVQIELAANRLILPTLPDIAVKVRDAVSNGDITAIELAKIISADPALSVKLIKVANCPLYRTMVEISSIQMAVARLGNNTIRTLVTSLMMQQMWTSPSSFLDQMLRPIWSQGISVAAISRAISIFAPHLNRDEAMLAGLIHQIGKLPILTLAEGIPEFRDNPNRMEKLLEKAHAPIGKMIMDTWHFPLELKTAAYEYIDFNRNTSEKADYTDIVQVAFLLNKKELRTADYLLDYKAVPSYNKLGLPKDTEVLAIDAIALEIQQARSLFI